MEIVEFDLEDRWISHGFGGQVNPQQMRLNAQTRECWVRFHSFADLQRYPASEADRKQLLRRHHAVLDTLLGAYESESLMRLEYDITATVVNDDMLDSLLLACASDWMQNLVLCPPDLAWFYCPYDGGTDVMVHRRAERDALRTLFARWLSPLESGL